MFQICIVPNNTDANLSLSYKLREDAEKTYETISEGMQHDNRMKLHDDYGYRCTVRGTAISYILFVDVEKSQLVPFDKQMAMDLANKVLSDKLEALGFKPQPPKKSPIIHN